jgi:hypothetical protein
MINVPRVNAPQIDPNMALKLTMPSINISPAINAYFSAKNARNAEAQQKLNNERQVVQDEQNTQVFDEKMNQFNANKPLNDLNRQNSLVSGQNQLNESINTYELKENEKFLTNATTQFANAKSNEEAFQIAENLKNDLIKKKEFITSQVPNATFENLDGAISQLNEIQNNPESAVGIVQAWNSQKNQLLQTKQSLNIDPIEGDYYLEDKVYSTFKDKKTGQVFAQDLSGNILPREKMNNLITEDQKKFNDSVSLKNIQGEKEVQVAKSKQEIELDTAREQKRLEIIGTKTGEKLVESSEKLRGFTSGKGLDEIIDLVSSGEVKTGGLQNQLLTLQNYLGVKGNTNQQSVRRKLGKEVLKQLKPTFGAQFTEKEGKWLERLEASYELGPDALIKVLEDVKKESYNASAKEFKFVDGRNKDGVFNPDIEEFASSLDIDEDTLRGLVYKKGDFYDNYNNYINKRNGTPVNDFSNLTDDELFN